jgi:hypothetical protein
MSETPESFRIAGHPVEVLSLGNHSIGVIRINKDVTVVFQIRNGGGSPFPDDGGCLGCRISRISQCANIVCPPIKEKNPNASCADAIRRCMDLACEPICGGGPGGGGGIYILA